MESKIAKTEREILSLMVESEEFRVRSMGKLRVVDFTEENQVIYKAILKLDRSNKKVELDSIRVIVGADLELPSPNPKKDYEAIVDSIQRKQSEVDILAAIEDFYDKHGDDFTNAKNDLMATLTNSSAIEMDKTTGMDIISDYYEYLEDEKFHKPIGKFGISKIDNCLDGIYKQRIYTVVSGPGVGKSSIAAQVFEESMKMGARCLFITTEMTKQQLTARMIARRINISPSRLKSEYLTDKEAGSMANAMGELSDLFESTKSAIVENVTTSQDVRNAIRVSALVDKVDLVILDHLHNLRGDTKIYNRISNAAHDIQEAVYKSGVAMVMLAQMSRADKKESNQDYVSSKGSGDVEEVSDVMIIAKRDRVNETKQNDLELTITKNRHGITGIVDAKIEFPSLVIKSISEGYNVPRIGEG
jgi:replicative DNA helicase